MKSFSIGIALLLASLAAGAATGAAPADPWSLVPTLPMACYGQQDDFDEVVAQRLATLTEQVGRQDGINEDLARISVVKDSAGEVDPWEMQRRMQENLMKDPQAAMKAMQEAQSVQDSPQANLDQEQKDQEQKKFLLGIQEAYPGRWEHPGQPAAH
jgi:hypothetical protein